MTDRSDGSPRQQELNSSTDEITLLTVERRPRLSESFINVSNGSVDVIVIVHILVGEI